MGELTRGEKGIHATVANAALIIGRERTLSGLVAYDEFSHRSVVTRAPPAVYEGGWDEPGPYPRELTETDVGLIQVYIQRAMGVNVSRDVTAQAVEMVAGQHRVHPVRAYLDGLVWDGVPRVETWLSDYLGAAPSKYTSAIGRMFLIAMVARVFKPGCKADYMMVLEGPQGGRKSSACAILGGPWFSDSLPDVRGGKDVVQHLNSKWLIEVAELSAFDKAESAALKAFVTRDTERYRPSYGRKEVIEPRQCLFIATTNKPVWMRDETGGRRFWPVKVARIDTDALQRDRDQLFAEAVVLFRKDVRWWPDGDFEAEHIRPEQEARYEADAWEEAIARYLNGLLQQGDPRTTALQVAERCLEIPKGRISSADQKRISAVLGRLGWVQKRSNSMRWYVPEAGSDPARQ